MKKRQQPLLRRTRVRLEYTAYPTVGGVRFRANKKLTALRVLLSERFGEAGLVLWEGWLLESCFDQEMAEIGRMWAKPGGGQDAK